MRGAGRQVDVGSAGWAGWYTAWVSSASRPHLAHRGSNRLALLALGLYLALFVIQLYIFPFWGPFSAIDEQLHCYQDGRNFAHYGFRSTALLPDRSTGSAPVQHP